MSKIIAIETSSSDYFLALSDKGNLLYNSAECEGLNKDKDLGLLLQTGLKQMSLKIEDIEMISINIGPGGLGAVRSGVSFANGLAFGLGVPLLPFNSFELCGFEASKNCADPILITSNAADGKAYGALYEGGEVKSVKYGSLSDISRALTEGLERCCLAGTHQDKLSEMITSIEWVKSGIKFASAVTQIELIAGHDISQRLTSEPVGPINELSQMFKEASS